MRTALALCLLVSTGPAAFALAPDDAGRQAIVRRCSDIYHASGHPCACPTDPMRNGAACGRRSAHDRPGGASPVCSVGEVTPELLKSPALLEERCHYHGR